MGLEEFVDKHVVRTGNAGVGIWTDDALLLVDPFMNEANERQVKDFVHKHSSKKKVIAFSHGHYDHGFRPDELRYWLGKGSEILVPEALKSAFGTFWSRHRELRNIINSHENRFHWLRNDSTYELNAISLRAFASDHFTYRSLVYILPIKSLASKLSSGLEHLKQPLGGLLGYVIDLAGTRMAHLGSLNNNALPKSDILFLQLLDKPNQENPAPKYEREFAAIENSGAKLVIPIHEDFMDPLLGEKDPQDFVYAMKGKASVKLLFPIYTSDKVMRSEICCENFRWLLDYVGDTEHLPSGFQGKDALDKLLNGITGNPRTHRLINNPDYLIRVPGKPWLAEEVKEEHLRDPDRWISNDFSVKLFGNGHEVIGGHRPLYQPGTFAGYQSMFDKQPRVFGNRIPLGRLFGSKMILKRVADVNNMYNLTKIPSFRVTDKVMYMDIDYYRKFKDRISSDVCDWYGGFMAGIGKFVGTRDHLVEEISCVTTEDERCTFRLNWDEYGKMQRFWVFMHSMVDSTYIKSADTDNLLKIDGETRLNGNVEVLTRAERDRRIEAEIQKGRAEGLVNDLETALQELKNSQIREDYLNQQLRVQEVLRTAEDVGAQILHDNKNCMQPITLLIHLMPYVIKSLESVYGQQKLISPDLVEMLQQSGVDILRGEKILTNLKSQQELAQLAALEILKGYQFFRQVYNPKETGRKELNRDLEASLFLTIDRNDRAYIDTDIQIDTIDVPKNYDSLVLNKTVFMNIIKNAKEAIIMKRSLDPSIQGKVLVRTRKSEDRTLVEIYDNGIGIPDGLEERIFDKKYTSKKGGTGLGLSGARFVLDEQKCGRVYASKSDLPDYVTKMVVELYNAD